MKKIYQTPETKMVKIANESLLGIGASGTEAESGVEGDAREGGLIWELEEVSEEN